MFTVNFIFPHLSLFALLPVDLRWCLVTDAHMRTGVVIEMDETGYGLMCLLERWELLLWMDILCLYYTISTLRYRIVRRLVVLCHRDGNTMFFQHSYVCVTTVFFIKFSIYDNDGWNWSCDEASVWEASTLSDA